MCFYFLHHLIFPLPPNLPLSLTSIFVITIERNRKDSANLGWYGAWFEGVGGCDAESRLSRDNGYMILLKGNELYQAIVGKRTSPRTRCTLKQRWLDRFMKRRPLLSLRLAQGIKWVRAEASIEGLTAFFFGVFEAPFGAEYRRWRAVIQYGWDGIWSEPEYEEGCGGIRKSKCLI